MIDFFKSNVVNIFIFYGFLVIFFRVRFFSLLKVRHKETWQQFEAGFGLFDFNIIGKKNDKTEFLENKSYLNLNDPKLTSAGSLALYSTILLTWLFRGLIVYIFIWPFIKVF